jgi:hypothetical protein
VTGRSFSERADAPQQAVELDERQFPPTALRFFGAVGAVGAACVTTTFLPATTSVVVRVAVVGLDDAVYATVPEPVPDEPMLSHTTELVAVHPHPVCVVTVMVPVPPEP